MLWTVKMVTIVYGLVVVTHLASKRKTVPWPDSESSDNEWPLPNEREGHLNLTV